MSEEASDLMQQGTEKMNNGDNNGAIELFEKLVEIEPENKEAWQNLGFCYDGVKNMEKAIFFILCNHKSNLIHMGGQHHF